MIHPDAVTALFDIRFAADEALRALGVVELDDGRWTVDGRMFDIFGEIFPLEHTDRTLSDVHYPDQCEGEHCTLHNRSDHHMRHMPQNWRPDRGIMERICEHGVGHPDPDERPGIDTVHGCDGCCTPPPKIYPVIALTLQMGDVIQRELNGALELFTITNIYQSPSYLTFEIRQGQESPYYFNAAASSVIDMVARS